MPLSFYPEGTAILPSDDSNRSLHKIASLLGASSGGGSGSSGIGQQVYYNRNPAAPNNPALDAISFDANGVISQWIGGGSSWT